MEWSSTRPPREGDNTGGLREKMEAYLGEAMEKGLVLDAVIAQTEAQSKALWALRENHTEASEAGRPVDQARHLGGGEQDPAVRARGAGGDEEGAARLPAAGVRPCRRRQSPFQLPGARRLEQAAVHAHTASRSAARSTISSPPMAARSRPSTASAASRSRSWRTTAARIELDVMRQLKRALDPHNIMNPGKVIRV